MPLKAPRIDSELKSLPKAKAAFIEPMLLLRTETLPEGAEWLYEISSMALAPSASKRKATCTSAR